MPHLEHSVRWCRTYVNVTCHEYFGGLGTSIPVGLRTWLSGQQQKRLCSCWPRHSGSKRVYVWSGRGRPQSSPLASSHHLLGRAASSALLWTTFSHCYISPSCVMLCSSPHRSWCRTSQASFTPGVIVRQGWSGHKWDGLKCGQL